MPLMDVKLMIWPAPLSIMAGAISRAQSVLHLRAYDAASRLSLVTVGQLVENGFNPV